MVTLKDIDYEADARGLTVPAEGLKTLSHLTAMQLGLESRIAELNMELDRLSAELRTVSEKDIPSLMEELGIGEYSLYDGTGVEIETGVQANISEKNKPKAYAWLDKHNHGDLIKNVVMVAFNREDQERAKKFVEMLTKKKLNIAHKQSIHASSLKAFVRIELEKEAKGEVKKKDRLPRDIFGVFEYKRTIIKLPKKTK